MNYSSRLSLALVSMTFVFATTAMAAPQKTFQEWLEHYGAWDRLEKEYASQTSSDTPEVILKRAQVYLNLNSPKEALEIIEMTPAFPDRDAEARRLWLGGQAHRGLGALDKAVLWYTQASQFMDKDDISRRFKAEPELENIWHDVWLKMFWSYSANHTLSRKTQKDALNMVMAVGRQVWGTDFWLKTNMLLNPSSPEAVKSSQNSTPLPDSKAVSVSDSDRRLIAQSMASVSLEKFDDAYNLVSRITQQPVKIFWSSIIRFLENGTLPAQLNAFEEANLLKPTAFWSGNILAPYSKSRNAWVLGNQDSAPWTQFRNNLLAMPVSEATKAIDNELGSMLISEETATLLKNFKLAFALSNGDFTNASTTWNSINKRSLPMALKVAGLLSFKENLNNVLPEKQSESYAMYPILSALSGAAGLDVNSRIDAPFWTSAPDDELKKLSQEAYPLDRLLLLAYWQQVFAKSPSVDLAKRAAFLFDDASFGIQGLIYLADDAVKAKELQLSAFYLNRIDATTLPPNLHMAWLDIKTRIELDSGRQGAALKTYQQMVKTGEPVPVMTRLRMALLFQQKKNYEAAKTELLAMWDQRASMTTALQAETLFWLGEGEHAMRNTDKALDYYLKLAWQYPQENIWALTAMYRASLIYEKRGKYETAKKLLGTVVRNAARKEQREAAKARIDAIDKKMGEQKGQNKSTLVYPF